MKPSNSQKSFIGDYFLKIMNLWCYSIFQALIIYSLHLRTYENGNWRSDFLVSYEFYCN